MKPKLLLAVLLSLILCIGCTKEQPSDPQGQTSLKLSVENLEVSYEGGEFSVEYVIENPLENVALEISCEKDWIEHFSTEKEGCVTFSVLENDEDSLRTAEVKVSYGKTDPQFIIVHQASSEIPYPEEDQFQIEFSKIMETSFCSTVKPVDKTASYINFINSSNFVDSFNDEGLFEDDMEYLRRMADKMKISLKEMVREYAMEGDIIEQPMLGVRPGQDYTLYVYGIDTVTLERTTHIVRKTVTTKSVEMLDVDFDIQVKVDGVMADASVTPENGFEGYYFTNANYGLPADTPYPDIESSMKSYFEGLLGVWLSTGMTMDEILQQMCFTGPTQREYQMTPNTECFISAFAVDQEGQICSKIAVEFYTTSSVELSDNEITLSVTDVKDRRAVLNISTTNEDPYIYVSCPVSDLNGVTEEELVSYLMMYYVPVSGQGTQKVELTTLMPETEYAVFVFGYDQDCVTTPVQRADFKTTEAHYADISISSDFGVYYSSEAVAELDAWYEEYATQDWALVPINIVTVPEDCEVFWAIYDPAIFDMVTEDSAINALINGAGHSGHQALTMLPYYMYATLCVVAIDADGNVSRLYRSEDLELSAEGVSDPQTFVEAYPGGSMEITPL